MSETLSVLVRVAGMILILLAALHLPIGRHLKWREESARLSPANAAIFHVHTFFICFVLVMMGLPCLLEPSVLLEKSHAGAWLAWSFSAFWTTRLFVQWFVLPKSFGAAGGWKPLCTSAFQFSGWGCPHCSPPADFGRRVG